MPIDVTFDFRSDARGLDPDQHSPTLRSFHKQLWSKGLPIGVKLDLSDQVHNAYLHAEVNGREFVLTSDGAIPTFTMRKRLQPLLSAVPANELEEFRNAAYTIGGFMIFPGMRRNGKMTINGARGFNSLISDRFDLTLECIRRHYQHQSSPLTESLELYADWFELFGDFAGYTDFFILQDFVTDGHEVRFHMPFDDFKNSDVPKDLATYMCYKALLMELVESRNQRIAETTE
jgi:hypothetical protein